MYGCNILCGISKGTFEIPHKISCPYIQRCLFYADVKILELLDLRDFDRLKLSPCPTCGSVIPHLVGVPWVVTTPRVGKAARGPRCSLVP